MTHQKDAVDSGYWPLFRYRPAAEAPSSPVQLDSRKPPIPVPRLRRQGGAVRDARPEPTPSAPSS